MNGNRKESDTHASVSGAVTSAKAFLAAAAKASRAASASASLPASAASTRTASAAAALSDSTMASLAASTKASFAASTSAYSAASAAAAFAASAWASRAASVKASLAAASTSGSPSSSRPMPSRSPSMSSARATILPSSAGTTRVSTATHSTSVSPGVTAFFCSAASMKPRQRTLDAPTPFPYTQSNFSSVAGGSPFAWDNSASARSRCDSYTAILASPRAFTAACTAGNGLKPRGWSNLPLSIACCFVSLTTASASWKDRWRSRMRCVASAGLAGGEGGSGLCASSSAATALRSSTISRISRTSSRFSSLRAWRFLSLRLATILSPVPVPVPVLVPIPTRRRVVVPAFPLCRCPPCGSEGIPRPPPIPVHLVIAAAAPGRDDARHITAAMTLVLEGLAV
mmetsp:Transcript_7055/g.11057  ORF Transcript_7055/g.11057 Transcript_7055/m.11057 type:complete len:400 (+) Transcript_7055:108-1307(+)